MNTLVVGDKKIAIEYVLLSSLKPAPYNPRKWDSVAEDHLQRSILDFDFIDPLIVNKAPGRENIIIGGNFRAAMALKLGIKTVPVVFIEIPDEEKEKELCLRLNQNTGEFDLNLLAQFDEKFLADIGFPSEKLDEIFAVDDTPEIFDLQKELDRLDIKDINIKKGDRFKFEDHGIVMCGNSMEEADMLTLMDGEKADLCLTDPPYLLNYLVGKKKHGETTQGFGLKRDRTYLGTETLPDNFTELWMANVNKVQKPDFSIIIFENPKNLRTIWNELEKYWKYRNTIIWHVPNRVQGFSAKYKFFNKSDIAVVGTSGKVELNIDPENEPLFQEEYESALFATAGKPTWEGYEKGKKICPTDFIEHVAADQKSSGQSIIFGTKPLPVLIPYLKVLTKRGDLVLEPFGGSGSSAVAAIKLGRRFRLMEKSEIYTAVILNRLTKLTGIKPIKI